jgi:ATP-dependent helicase HrpB
LKAPSGAFFVFDDVTARLPVGRARYSSFPMNDAAPLPIDHVLPDILAALATQSRLVLEAPPGAGKTTRVPLALLEAPWLGAQTIIVLEPRRLAARAAARYMSAQLGEAVGTTVGYRVRFEAKVSAATRIEVVTEGILTRMLQDDPSLFGVGAVLFDEFHERHLNTDLGLALALDAQAGLRPDLRLLVMSATLDGERLATFLDAPRVRSEGRSFPVRVVHPALRPNEDAMTALSRIVDIALRENEGDVLVFLPGKREIAQATRRLGAQLRAPDGAAVDIVELHGELDLSRQADALAPDPDGRRRVVLATNVAESSVTLPGVRAVVDLGLAREPRFDPNSGFTRLATVPITAPSATQRAGRAGRLGPGTCYRLWPESQRLDAATRPELAHVELSALLLELTVWGSTGVRFLDPPPAGNLAQARDTLHALGALDDDARVTARGRQMLALGTHPRLAAMALSASHGEDRALAADLIALVESRDPFRGESARDDRLDARWRALAAFRGRGPAGATARASERDPASREALAALADQARQWRRRLQAPEPPTQVEAHRLGDLLIAAFPDRIARQHARDAGRYALSNGRGARLGDASGLRGEPWIVIVELRHEARDSLILKAVAFDSGQLQSLYPERFATVEDGRFDLATQGVAVFRERRFMNLVLERERIAETDPRQRVAGLIDGVRQLGLDALPWSDGLRQWQQRVESLRVWLPALGLPAVDDDALMTSLDDWLAPFLHGTSRLSALSSEDFGHALRSRLDHAQQQAVNRLAPVALDVPSGRELRLRYVAGQAPVLPVKLQEMFGCADTPTIADGTVAVILHLLSPAQRPIQVTQDLRGFWERTYPEVKKELKGRYPRHPWPDDPWNAIATHRAKPRGT